MSNPLKIIKILSLFNLLINPPSHVEFSFSDETCENCYKIPDVNFYFHFIDAKMKVDEIFIVSERLVTIVHKCCILLISFIWLLILKWFFFKLIFGMAFMHRATNLTLLKMEHGACIVEIYLYIVRACINLIMYIN